MRLSISVFAMPADTNSQNSVFGGWLLSHMDLAGLVECKMYAPGRYVTVAIDKMKFVKPVAVGDLVQIFTQVEHVGKSSITVKLIAEANRLDGQPPFQVTEAQMTFVRVDEDGNKMFVQ